jgi:subtilisin family serine protease
MNRRITLFFLVAFPLVVFGTNNSSKLSAGLQMLLHKYEKEALQLTKKSGHAEMIHIVLRGNPEMIKSKILSEGGYVNTVAGNIITAQVPLNRINKIADDNSVQKIELPLKTKTLNDEAIKHVKADKVHNGNLPLGTGLKGKDVIVGIIDSGIDFNHPEFKFTDDNTKSRILFIWDQADNSGTPPAGFSYGTEYTKEQIDDEIDGTPTGIVKQKDTNGHGTHVAGTAAGNSGLAPLSKIIIVKGLDNVLDAANYIYKKADELGLPAVINASLGTHATAHDGASAENMGLDNLLSAKNGRVFCAAAGNEGSDFVHFGGFNMNNEEVWTYYFGNKVDSERSVLAFDIIMVVENQYLDQLSLAVAVDSAGYSDTHSLYFPIVKTDESSYVPLKTIVDDQGIEAALNYRDKQKAGEVAIKASGVENNKTMFQISFVDIVTLNGEEIASGKDIWRINLKGTGLFHIWNEEVGSFSNPAAFGITVDQNYKGTDNKYSVGDPATGKTLITVGSYSSRNSWVSPSGESMSWDFQVGNLSDFSSIGPTADGRIKPEIIAPGQMVISARSADTNGEGTGDYVNMQGTSMATPVVTGAIALYLEKFPNKSNAQIKEDLLNTTIRDEYTNASGALPNNFWGYGKLDIFEAISKNITSVEDEIIPTTFTVSQNYPNPFNPSTEIKYSLPKAANVKLSVYNIMGQEIAILQNSFQNEGNRKAIWNGLDNKGQSVASGIYFFYFNAMGDGFNYHTIKKGILLK